MSNVLQIKAVSVGEKLPECHASEASAVAAYWKANITKLDYYDPEKEHLFVFILNTKLQIKAVSLVSIGSLNESIAQPREVFRPAIAFAGYSIILVHNRPTGNPSPSSADQLVAQRMADAGKILNIPLTDFIMIGDESTNNLPYYSLRENGRF